jgi:hypothetical protein
MKKYSILILCVGLALLIFTQKTIIMPWVLDVVGSDLFLVKNKDLASQEPISNSLTELAFKHCNDYIKSEADSDITITFPIKALNAWSLGNYHYVVNAEITTNSKDGSNHKYKYACRIDYKNGDDTKGVPEYDNWSIQGVDGIDDLN